MRIDEHRIEAEPGSAVSSLWAFPERFSAGATPALILAHGAGSDMHHPFLAFMQEALVARGIMTVKFNFPYTEAGRKSPDPPQRLLHTWQAVIKRLRKEARPGALCIGGKSMGGRIASMLAARGESGAGL